MSKKDKTGRLIKNIEKDLLRYVKIKNRETKKIKKNKEHDLTALYNAAINQYNLSLELDSLCTKITENLKEKTTQETLELISSIKSRIDLILPLLEHEIENLKSGNIQGYLNLYDEEEGFDKRTVGKYEPLLRKLKVRLPRKALVKTMIVLSLLMGNISESEADTVNDQNNITHQVFENRVQLGTHEYVIPDKVMEIFAFSMNEKGALFGAPKGVCISQRYLDNANKKDFFIKELKKKNYASDQINKYLSILNTTGNIVLSQTTFNNSDELQEILSHERMHKLLKELRREPRNNLKLVAEEMLKLIENRSELFPQTNPGLSDMHNAVRNAKQNWEEFYTYMAMDKFSAETKQLFKKAYPKYYEFFEHLEKISKR